MTPLELAKVITALDPWAPVTAQLVIRYWHRKIRVDQRDHWLRWLADHWGRGTRDSGYVYDHLQSAPMILWLNEQSGAGGLENACYVISSRLGRPIGQVHPQSQCERLRSFFPWRTLHARLTNLNSGEMP